MGLDVDHGDFNHVGGGALYGGVNGGTLGVASHGGVGGGDVAEVAAAAGEGFDVALFFGGLDGAVHEFFHGWVFCEIGLDDFGGFATWDAEALREAEGGDAVDDAEIYHLSSAAHVRDDVIDSDSVNFRCSCSMNIEIIFEGIDHRLITRERCHHTEFDLRVIRCEEGEVFSAWDEGST